MELVLSRYPVDRGKKSLTLAFKKRKKKGKEKGKKSIYFLMFLFNNIAAIIYVVLGG